MKYLLFLFAFLNLAGFSQAQTYEGKIGDGSVVSITISKTGSVVTATRQVVTNTVNESPKLVNQTGIEFNNQHQLEIPSSNSVWIIPFDPTIQAIQATGGCYEYRCNCGAGCSAGGDGCEVITIDGIARCRPVTGPNACGCCAGFLVKVKCEGSTNSPAPLELGPSSFILIEADRVNN